MSTVSVLETERGNADSLNQMFAGRRFPDFVSIVSVIGCIVLTLFYYDSLPSVMPTSFNFSGQAQAFGPKWTAWIPSAASIFVYIFLVATTRIPAKLQLTDENRPRMVSLVREMNAWVRMWLTIMFFLVNIIVIRSAITGQPQLGLTPITLSAVGVIILTKVIYNQRMRKAV
ncbi:MAG: DUF1648 domain-containing protein [Vulcanimicrobiaceae bacterium]|jgi:uncharacterized membrane protein